MSLSTVSKLTLAGAIIVLGFSAWWVFGPEGQKLNDEQNRLALESGMSLFAEQKYEEAINRLQSVAEESPYSWRAKYYEGSSLVFLRDYAQAVRVLEQSLLLNPEGDRILHALGVAHYKLGNLKLSRAYFAQVLEINPGDLEARGLMDIMSRLERQSEAPPDEG